MELKKALRMYKDKEKAVATEENIIETIEKSKEVFLLGEQEYQVYYFEFLMAQFRLIRKRWWGLQTLMLCVVFIVLPGMQDKFAVLRMLGVIGVLFVVLIIPEFWKNKHYDCMQVEGICMYSLRQIYAARMIWFGVVDIFILTVFCGIVSRTFGFWAVELMIQFLFPMLVAACICFGTLCSNKFAKEGIAILGCLLWSTIWCLIILNDAVYTLITAPVWCMLFAFFMTFLVGAIYKTIHDCNKYWEVNFSGITNG